MEPQRAASQGKRNSADSASNNPSHPSGTNGHPTNVRKGGFKLNAPKNNTSPPRKEEVISQEFEENTEVQVTKNETAQKETWAELEDSEEYERQESQESDQSENQESEQSENRFQEKQRKRLEAKKNKKLQQRGEIPKPSAFLEPKLNLFLKVAGLKSYRQVIAEKNLRLEDLLTLTNETMTSMGITKADQERFKEAIDTKITRVPTSGN